MRMRRSILLLALLLLTAPTAFADEIKVMTSGAFTAAYLELAPAFERATGVRVVTEATSIGAGPTGIVARLDRGEAIDVVIVAEGDFERLTKAGRIRPGTRVDLARSAIGMAVRRGAPRPDISTVDALRRALLNAKSIAYSASVSGTYLSTELLQRLGIADEVLAKSRRIENERVGAVVARGDAEIGVQQISELLPIAGIDLVGPLPPEVQRVTVFAAGVGAASASPALAARFIAFLASPAAADVIRQTALEPIVAAPKPGSDPTPRENGRQYASPPEPQQAGRPSWRVSVRVVSAPWLASRSPARARSPRSAYASTGRRRRKSTSRPTFSRCCARSAWAATGRRSR